MAKVVPFATQNEAPEGTVNGPCMETPSKRLLVPAKVRTWPVELSTVPPVIVPPLRVKIPEAGEASVAPVFVSVPLRFKVPPRPLMVWASNWAVVNVPVKLIVPPEFAVNVPDEPHVPLPRVTVPPLMASIVPALLQVAWLEATVSVAPSAFMRPVDEFTTVSPEP